MGGMRAKFINEFERGLDPKKALSIGRVGKIQKWFRDLGIPDRDKYTITPRNVVFYKGLDLEGKNVVWLPDGLKIYGRFDLRYTPIKELPRDLNVESLVLFGTEITQLPDDLNVKNEIFVRAIQHELIKYIESSKFLEKLIIRH